MVHYITHSLTHSLMYALFLTYTCLLSIPLYHFFTRLLTHSLTHTHSIYMHFCFHSCLHILTYLLTYLLTHSLTHCHYSGAAIPEIADDLNRENTSLSIIYTARGVGFFIGTFFGTAQNELPVFKLIRTDVLVCIPTLVVALGSFILFIIPLKLWVILVVVCVQASMFSFLDVVANIMLMELWGKRVEVR
jgi:MFS family permease